MLIFGLSVSVLLLLVGLAFAWATFRYQWRPPGAARWPAPAAAPEPRRQHDLEKELRPYRTGEYPQVAAEPVEVEPVDQIEEPEPVVEHTGTAGYVSRHAADEDLAEPEVRPWLRPTLHTEPTPFFSATGAYPVFDLDLLSATGAWGTADRAALQALLDMDEEKAA